MALTPLIPPLGIWAGFAARLPFGLHKINGSDPFDLQLAERLSVSQQAVTAYESGQRRVPISMLPLLANTLGVSIEELIGTPTAAKRGTGKRGPAPKLQQQIERVTQLPKARQRVVSEVLDSLLAQAGR